MANNSFSLDLRAYAEKMKGDIDQVVREAIIDVSSRIVAASPVGDPVTWKDPPPPGYVGGRFRGSWQLGVDSEPTELVRVIDPDGTVSVDRITAAIPDKASGKKYFITNNSPYAVRLEDGWSYMQAPLGVVGLVVFDWEKIVKEAIGKAQAAS